MTRWRSHDGRGRATVDFVGCVNGRGTYRYSLDVKPHVGRSARFLCVATAADLCGPAMGREPSERDMLATLASFVAAWAESNRYGENGEGENSHLFPKSAEPWEAYADEFSMWGMDFEERLDKRAR
jgi:hypothetical protein